MAKKSNTRHELYNCEQMSLNLFIDVDKGLDKDNINFINDLTRFDELMTTSKPLYDENTEKQYRKAKKTAIEKYQKEHFGEKSIIRT